LARSRLPERYVGAPAQVPMIEIALGGRKSGPVRCRRPWNGISVKNSFERSPTSGWVVGVAVPAVIVDAPLWHTALIMMAIGGVLTLLSLALALTVANYLSRAIRRLGMAAVAIASGDVVRMPKTHIAELRDVSRSIEVTGEGRAAQPGSGLSL